MMSRATFAPALDGTMIPFRSALEARWAVVLTAIGAVWHYEPESFMLDTGRTYTPDFLVEAFDGPAWIEVKPHMDGVMDARPKLGALRRGFAAGDSRVRLFTFAADRPRFRVWTTAPPPVLLWSPMDGDGMVRPVRERVALEIFSGETGRALLAETPDAYADYVERVMEASGRTLAAQPSVVGEEMFRAIVEAGVPFNVVRQAYADGTLWALAAQTREAAGSR